MAERIQDLLARHKAAQIDAGNSRATRILRSLQVQVARANARGAFVADEVIPQAVSENPGAQVLVETESLVLQRFFGREIEVPQVPTELFRTLDVMKEARITHFEARYLPSVELTQKDKLPGWIVKPEPWFWQQIKEGRVAKDTSTLRAGWYLVDGRGKPNYQDGQQRYEDDAWFQATIDDLRGLGRVKAVRGVAFDSRFGVSPDEVEQVILPEFAKTLGASAVVRTPREIEFNVLGNIHHPEWGNTSTWEIMNDKFGDGSRLVGGSSGYGGLADVRCGWSGPRGGNVAFRSLVDFSQLPKP